MGVCVEKAEEGKSNTLNLTAFLFKSSSLPFSFIQINLENGSFQNYIYKMQLVNV